ncbi:MAG: carbamoyltransferase [Polyangiaceae bacterium]
MNILGISAHFHDSAAALVVDGMPIAAVQEERLSRNKNDPAFPLHAIEWCLEQGKLEPRQLDAVVFYEKPMLKFDRILTSALRAFPKSWRSFPHAMKNTLGEKLWVKGIIKSYLGVSSDKILFTEHHQAHAAAAFLTQPTKRAAILTADGVGEWATLSVGVGERTDDGTTSIKLLRELRFPHSLGMLYSTFTAFLGFQVNEGEYKVMGLASYGKPEFVDEVRKVIRPVPGKPGAFTLDLDYFDFHTTAKRSFSDKFVSLFGPPRAPHQPLDPTTPEGARYANVAASVQRVLEDTLVELTRSLHEETGLPDLCFGGGVALNGVANGRILRESGFSNLYVPSSPGDAGCALGAALYADRIHFGNKHKDVPDHPYWGPVIVPEDLERIAREDGLPLDTAADESEMMDRTVSALVDGKIVGWMDGAAEFGPRALGNRSILAAPHTIEMKDRLNKEIKYREEFRPFAPAVPIEVADKYFDLPPGGARLGAFMSGVFPVRPEWKDKLAAITHVDGTARVQTVERDKAPRFYELLERYGAKTGIPVLLNTSFNLAGEPIVTRAVEGYSTFRRCGIDVLVAGRHMVSKKSATLQPLTATGEEIPPGEALTVPMTGDSASA